MINSHKSNRVKQIAAVKKAMIATCIRHGITDTEDIRAMSVKAASAIKKMTLPSLIGWYGNDLSNIDRIE